MVTGLTKRYRQAKNGLKIKSPRDMMIGRSAKIRELHGVGVGRRHGGVMHRGLLKGI